MKSTPDHLPTLIDLINLYIQLNQIDNSEKLCFTVLKIDPNNESIVSILSKILSDQDNTDKAIETFEESLKSKPDNFFALYRIIQLFYYSGNVKRSLEYIERAEKLSETARNSPGYFYCKGLYLNYVNQTYDAVDYLNRSRANIEWKPLALELMVQIYINPGNQKLYLIKDIDVDSLTRLVTCDHLLEDPYFTQNQDKYLVKQKLK